jgi:hypothetical protein
MAQGDNDGEVLNFRKFYVVRNAVEQARAMQEGVYFGVAVYILFPNAGGWFITDEQPPIDLLYFVVPNPAEEDQRVRVNLFADYLPPSQWLGDVR